MKPVQNTNILLLVVRRSLCLWRPVNLFGYITKVPYCGDIGTTNNKNCGDRNYLRSFSRIKFKTYAQDDSLRLSLPNTPIPALAFKQLPFGEALKAEECTAPRHLSDAGSTLLFRRSAVAGVMRQPIPPAGQDSP